MRRLAGGSGSASAIAYATAGLRARVWRVFAASAAVIVRADATPAAAGFEGAAATYA